ncbi:L-alanine-DL-glutamate epimerase-like enolase superfamily enzyme [Alkalibacillus salilacus]|uniref:L-alanine-DL-glutamate epimerase-like enolase superfamily enzyme n=1 Tax=Alkalibacillus salilacus TaxID=284582 RepID=A0ABT9VHZ2_9BACI|nr:L-alanine-DL-glutamate epimerase-like enolase superfamily enzyme [Alkalibacillus salilacus]
MKITSLITYVVPPRWLFLKIKTDDGLIGWGEPVVEGRAETVKAAVHELEDYLIGKNPLHIEDHWNVMYRGGFYHGGPIRMSAIAGIDQALWDIKGKYYDAPVYELMGGACYDSIKVYSWTSGDQPSDVGQAAKDVVDKEFRAVKMNETEELQYIDTYAKIDQVAECVAVVREAVGPDIGIGIDFQGRDHKPMAKVLAK